MLQELIFEYRRQERDKHAREPGTVWVSDLVKCPLKVIFSEKYPEIPSADIYDPKMLVGVLVHIGFENLLKVLREQGLLNYQVEVEVEGSREVETRLGKITVKGRIDALLSSDTERIGVEIKYTAGDRGLPLEHHELQCKIYNWLFDLPKTILIYFTPSRTAEYVIEERATDGEIVALIESEDKPRWKWECKYCRYAILCPLKVSTV